jgi:hypothetical protein
MSNRVSGLRLNHDQPKHVRYSLPISTLPSELAEAVRLTQSGSPLNRERHCSSRKRVLRQHHESLGTTSATRRSICSASSKTGLSRISSAPAPATSRRPRTQASGGP